VRIDSFSDYARLLNAILALSTTLLMWTVTWRLAPKMRWYELAARQGITLIFFGTILRNSEILTDPTPAHYTLTVFISTIGFTVTTIAFIWWVKNLPRRPWRWLARVQLKWRRPPNRLPSKKGPKI
jgi:hypothetical protein